MLAPHIQKTISFFSLFNYPLTAFEVWKYLPVKAKFSEVLFCLDNGLENINQKNGQYFPALCEKNLEKRNRRYNYSDRKFKQAIKISKIFRFIPYIKMIAIVNIIGSANMRNESDIDFFIVTVPKRIWLTRFFCVLIAKILNKRPQKNKTKDTICLSFYITEDNLNLENLMLNSLDWYFIYWLACLVPIYDADNYYEKLINHNLWLKKTLPNWKKNTPSNRLQIKNKKYFFSNFYNYCFDFLFGNFENIIKKFQLKIMPEILKQKMNQDKSVIINDQILKLHINDRRKNFIN